MDPDPNPDLSDPHVFGRPGSGSGSDSQRYGSGSFYHQAKIVRKPVIPTALWLLLDVLSLKNYVNVNSKNKKQKILFKKISFLLASGRSVTKIAGSGSGSISQRHGSADPDPDPDLHQNVIDPQHWFKLSVCHRNVLRYLFKLESSTLNVFITRKWYRIHLSPKRSDADPQHRFAPPWLTDLSAQAAWEPARCQANHSCAQEKWRRQSCPSALGSVSFIYFYVLGVSGSFFNHLVSCQ